MENTELQQFPFAVPLLSEYYIEWYSHRELAESVALDGDYIPPTDEMADFMFSRIKESQKQVLAFLLNPEDWLRNASDFPESADAGNCHYFQSVLGELMDLVLDEYIGDEIQEWMKSRREPANSGFNWETFAKQLAA